MSWVTWSKKKIYEENSNLPIRGGEGGISARKLLSLGFGTSLCTVKIVTYQRHGKLWVGAERVQGYHPSLPPEEAITHTSILKDRDAIFINNSLLSLKGNLHFSEKYWNELISSFSDFCGKILDKGNLRKGRLIWDRVCVYSQSWLEGTGGGAWGSWSYASTVRIREPGLSLLSLFSGAWGPCPWEGATHTLGVSSRFS